MILSTVKNTHLNLNLSLKTFSYQTLSTCYFLSWCPFHKKKNTETYARVHTALTEDVVL